MKRKFYIFSMAALGFIFLNISYSQDELPAPSLTQQPTIVINTAVTFAWSNVDGALGYRLQVNTASDFSEKSYFDNKVNGCSQEVILET